MAVLVWAGIFVASLVALLIGLRMVLSHKMELAQMADAQRTLAHAAVELVPCSSCKGHPGRRDDGDKCYHCDGFGRKLAPRAIGDGLS